MVLAWSDRGDDSGAMAKHRLEDKIAPTQGQTRSGFFNLRRRDADNLYERSFRFCTKCGNEVYVLADGCKHCGESRDLTPEPALNRAW